MNFQIYFQIFKIDLCLNLIVWEPLSDNYLNPNPKVMSPNPNSMRNC